MLPDLQIMKVEPNKNKMIKMHRDHGKDLIRNCNAVRDRQRDGRCSVHHCRSHLPLLGKVKLYLVLTGCSLSGKVKFFVGFLVLTGCQAIFSPFAPVGTPFFVSGLIKTNAMCARCWCQALSIRLEPCILVSS